MHRCSSSQGNMMGQCYQCQNNNSSSSWLFSMPNHTSYDETNMYSFMSSSVDCTLSLGTPSTRLCEDEDNKHITSGSSSYCWDLLQQNKNAPSYSSHQTTKAARGGSNGDTSNDTLLARRCANCDTTSTPLWRNGPRGPKSLCNACGIRFKKEERRATTANANNNSPMLEHQQQYRGYDYNYHSSWVNHHSQDQKIPCFSPLNEFRFIER